MTARPALDGAVPLGSGASHEVALAALTRRVAELEHRIDTMKVIIGLVLTGKVLLIAFLVYVVFGSTAAVRSGAWTWSIWQQAEPARSAGEGRPV